MHRPAGFSRIRKILKPRTWGRAASLMRGAVSDCRGQLLILGLVAAGRGSPAGPLHHLPLLPGGGFAELREYDLVFDEVVNAGRSQQDRDRRVRALRCHGPGGATEHPSPPRKAEDHDRHHPANHAPAKRLDPPASFLRLLLLLLLPPHTLFLLRGFWNK